MGLSDPENRVSTQTSHTMGMSETDIGAASSDLESTASSTYVKRTSEMANLSPEKRKTKTARKSRSKKNAQTTSPMSTRSKNSAQTQPLPSTSQQKQPLQINSLQLQSQTQYLPTQNLSTEQFLIQQQQQEQLQQQIHQQYQIQQQQQQAQDQIQQQHTQMETQQQQIHQQNEQHQQQPQVEYVSQYASHNRFSVLTEQLGQILEVHENWHSDSDAAVDLALHTSVFYCVADVGYSAVVGFY
ncbi:hypothetical protein O3M35_007626 [Rhynocoris fuscipes]|uniref:Uncharacterized protein n=1 Tax=Rhynocoris fuscipes TaxID=488301 RepID=A0AAW1DA88_9HEMI